MQVTLINITPYFDPSNNGFVYVCPADDGTFWVRSVNGTWAQLDIQPVSLAGLQDDITTFLANNVPATPQDLINDNTGVATKNFVLAKEATPPQNEIPT